MSSLIMTAAAPTFPQILLPFVNIFITLCGISVGALMRHFRRVGPISHFQRRIVLDVIMSCLINSYFFFYSKLDGGNSCQYA